MPVIMIFPIATLVAFVLTYLARHYALTRSLFDEPNQRSMHVRPVPRGGGAAIVITFVLGTLWLAWTHVVTRNAAMALIGGGLPVALVGWLDDRRGGISSRFRLTVHLASASWAVLWLGGLRELHFGDTTVLLGPVGTLLGVVGIVWWINLYNFMDGIDGLAGGEALTVPLAAAALIVLQGSDSAEAALALLLAGSALGFLIWNWSPARIFMGDVGSGFLGFVFATLAICTEHAGTLHLGVWVLISGVFVFDATVTLIRRVARGERFYHAHRTHAYQRLVSSGLTHRQVALVAIGLNIILALIGAWTVVAGGPFILAAVLGLALMSGYYLYVERILPMHSVGARQPALKKE